MLRFPHHLAAATIILIAAIMQSCTPGSSTQTVTSAIGNLDNAEAMVDDADLLPALSLADNIRTSLTPEAIATDTTTAAVALGRLSIIYMRMADEADASTDHVATAYQCYKAAFATDSAAAQDYFSTLPVDYMRHASLLNSLAHAADVLADPEDQEPDSIFIIPATQE